ncbi:MAG TPA: phage tail sheath C-terminal domain-containing protein [Gemmatimonadaceae bacterium]|nr:phage tail sheath C-terminal domain-containing protein [Gemmatimonadaceae bacterium]
MAPYLAPGVYLRPRRNEQPAVGLVRTDVAAFIGFAERGPLALPSLARALRRMPRPEDLVVRLNSWDEYRATFGGLTPYGLMPYAVRGFFENGGRTCRVVRVAAVSRGHEHEPRVARWLYLGPDSTRHVDRLGQPATGGDSRLEAPLLEAAVTTAPLLTTGLIEVVPADGSQPEFHVRIPPDPDTPPPAVVEIGGKLRRSYPAGSIVRLHEAALEIEATSAGNWGNRIRLELRPTDVSEGSGASVSKLFSLRVTLDPGPDTSHPREEEFYHRLSIDPRDDTRRSEPPSAVDLTHRVHPDYVPDVINSRSRVIRVVFPRESEILPRSDGRTVVARQSADRGPVLAVSTATRFGPPIRLEGGRDGLKGVRRDPAGGRPPLLIGEDWLEALRNVEAIDEVSVLCAPDVLLEPAAAWTAPPRPASPPCARSRPEPAPDVVAEDPTARPDALTTNEIFTMYAAMLEQCERQRDRVALLDPPASANRVGSLLTWRRRAAELTATGRRFAACYAPWIAVTDPTRNGTRRLVPASGHVAGVYAQIDNAFGVQRPPANVALVGVEDVAEPLTARDQEELNPRGINLLRPFPGRGVRVWGARSLSDEPEWRFIHVRRVMSMIQESVDDSTQWTVFESNDETLRRTLTHSLSVFLRGIWDAGGLKGAVPEEAFFVKCDETNNPRAVIDSGQLVCQIGVAIAAPMEFLVFEIRQQAAGAEIVEG